MQVQFKLKIGETDILLTDTIETPTDFFTKLSFYQSLPKVGPNGETDLQITQRKTKEGYIYNSIVSESAGKEFAFGALNDGNGELFPKGWQELFVYSNPEEGNSNVSTNDYPGTEEPNTDQPKSNVSQQADDILAEFGL